MTTIADLLDGLDELLTGVFEALAGALRAIGRAYAILARTGCVGCGSPTTEYRLPNHRRHGRVCAECYVELGGWE